MSDGFVWVNWPLWSAMSHCNFSWRNVDSKHWSNMRFGALARSTFTPCKLWPCLFVTEETPVTNIYERHYIICHLHVCSISSAVTWMQSLLETASSSYISEVPEQHNTTLKSQTTIQRGSIAECLQSHKVIRFVKRHCFPAPAGSRWQCSYSYTPLSICRH